MELLFIALGGAILGTAARYALPGRAMHGVTLLPAIGTITAMVVWVALTWLGWAWDGGWIWVAALVASAIVPAVVGLVIAPRRERRDHAEFERLAKHGVAHA